MSHEKKVDDEIFNTIEVLTTFIENVAKETKIPDVMLRRSLSESWFSDTLAWLLDPKSGDKTGVKFVEAFIRLIAKKRSDSSNGYRRRGKYLKSGKEGSGRPISGSNRLSLKNAAILREFYLSKSECVTAVKGAQYCDIVIIDLDTKDGVFIAIENKLFTTNHPYQLENYYNLIEEKYKGVKTLEYVYLTLLGDKPECFKNEKSYSKILLTDWIRISWVDDILPLIEKVSPTANEDVEDVRRIKLLLTWIKNVTHHSSDIANQIDNFTKLLIEAARDCLVDELKRLCKTGEWKHKENIKSSIVHSSIPARVLYVQMLPNMFITVQGKKRSKKFYEKILIPFGAYPDQVYHMMDIAARGIYYKHFENPSIYLNNKKKQTITMTESRKRIKPILEFLYKYKCELQVLLSTGKLIKQANKKDLEIQIEYLNNNG